MGSVSLLSQDSFSSSSLYSTDSAQQLQQSAQQARQITQTSSEEDSVKLSAAAQAKMLYKQGESVSTIAHAMGTSTKTINDYLGITLEKELEKTLQETESAKA
jgi:DNA-binding NarL/FixJ family response regulator